MALSNSMQKSEVDGPLPPYSAKAEEDTEMQNLDIPQPATSEPLRETLCSPYPPVMPTAFIQQEYVPPKHHPAEHGATGLYLNKRNSRIAAVVMILMTAALIAGWALAIVFASKLSQAHHVAAVNASSTVRPTSLASIISTTQAPSTTLPSSTITSTISALDQTVTQTSILVAIPTSLPNSTVAGCRELLNQICRNIVSVPIAISGGGSGQFGVCEPVFRYFYCEYLFDLSNTPAAVGAQPKEVNGSWPTVEAMECVGMRDYCVNYGESTGFEGNQQD